MCAHRVFRQHLPNKTRSQGNLRRGKDKHFVLISLEKSIDDSFVREIKTGGMLGTKRDNLRAKNNNEWPVV